MCFEIDWRRLYVELWNILNENDVVCFEKDWQRTTSFGLKQIARHSTGVEIKKFQDKNETMSFMWDFWGLTRGK